MNENCYPLLTLGHYTAISIHFDPQLRDCDCLGCIEQTIFGYKFWPSFGKTIPTSFQEDSRPQAKRTNGLIYVTTSSTPLPASGASHPTHKQLIKLPSCTTDVQQPHSSHLALYQLQLQLLNSFKRYKRFISACYNRKGRLIARFTTNVWLNAFV
jgi:hypothetical protein